MPHVPGLSAKEQVNKIVSEICKSKTSLSLAMDKTDRRRCPFLRKKIRNYCLESHIPVPEVSVRKSQIILKHPTTKETKRFKSTELAV
ncbi:hypothetical protein V3C99_011996 [Haemonchus contortus]